MYVCVCVFGCGRWVGQGVGWVVLMQQTIKVHSIDRALCRQLVCPNVEWAVHGSGCGGEASYHVTHCYSFMYREESGEMEE